MVDLKSDVNKVGEYEFEVARDKLLIQELPKLPLCDK